MHSVDESCLRHPSVHVRWGLDMSFCFVVCFIHHNIISYGNNCSLFQVLAVASLGTALKRKFLYSDLLLS